MYKSARGTFPPRSAASGSSRRPIRLAAACLALAVLGTTADATAEDDGGVWRDLALTVSVDGGDSPLSCQLLLAHWFEVTVGPVSAAEPVQVPLRVRPETGDVALNNTAGKHMRIERIVCGTAATTRRDWVEVDLDRLRRASGPVALSCQAGATPESPLACSLT